jgi:hypothetical protein
MKRVEEKDRRKSRQTEIERKVEANIEIERVEKKIKRAKNERRKDGGEK